MISQDLRIGIKKRDLLTIENLQLPNTPLTHLWIKQSELLEEANGKLSSDCV